MHQPISRKLKHQQKRPLVQGTLYPDYKFKRTVSFCPPGMLAGESGPVRGVLALAGDPAGEGEGPRMPGRWGEVWGEKGDWAGLLCSPWLLDTPEVLTPGLRAPSVPVGRSSMDPERSWKHRQAEQGIVRRFEKNKQNKTKNRHWFVIAGANIGCLFFSILTQN